MNDLAVASLAPSTGNRPAKLVNDLTPTPRQRATYRRTGALVIKNLFTDDGMQLLIRANEKDVNQSDHPEKFAGSFDRYSNRFFSRSDRLKDMVGTLDGVLARIVEEDVVFTQGIVLHMNQGTPGFKWHFDEFSYCFVGAQDMAFTLWIPLISIDTADQHGGLTWVNQNDYSARCRMQQWEHFERQGVRLDDSSGRYGGARTGQYGDTWVGEYDRVMLDDHQTQCDMELGDALMFDRFTWHKSHPLGPGPIPSRTAIVLRVVSADARFNKDLFESVMANRADQEPPPSFGHLLAAFDHGTSMREAVAAGVSIWSPTAPAEPDSPVDQAEPAREGDLQQKLVLTAAAERGIGVTDVSDTMHCRAALLESGGRAELLVQGIMAGAMNLRTKHFCDFKQLTKILFERLQIPSPASMLFQTLDQPGLGSFIQAGRQYVCKPQVAANGIGVEMGITSFQQVRDYWQQSHDLGDAFLLEEQIDGEDLRLQVIGGRIVAACIRVPAYLVGDGEQTLGRLVERRSQEVHEQNPSDSLELDKASFALLEEQDLTLESVPEAGRRVQLKAVSNIGQGGIAVDVTGDIHPRYQDWVRRIVDFCDASFFALDLICRDHTEDPETNAVALELNALAEWTHHTYSERATHDLGSVVIEATFGT